MKYFIIYPDVEGSADHRSALYSDLVIAKDKQEAREKYTKLIHTQYPNRKIDWKDLGVIEVKPII